MSITLIRDQLSLEVLRQLIGLQHEDEQLDFKEYIDVKHGGWVEQIGRAHV